MTKHPSTAIKIWLIYWNDAINTYHQVADIVYTHATYFNTINLQYLIAFMKQTTLFSHAPFDNTTNNHSLSLILHRCSLTQQKVPASISHQSIEQEFKIPFYAQQQLLL